MSIHADTKASDSNASATATTTTTTMPTTTSKIADSVDGYGYANVKHAGNRNRDHYKISMNPRRFRLRQMLLPLIRSETPRLARIQQTFRTKFWDNYFAFSANLGTHTFFVITLPLPFWFDLADLGRTLVYTLAAGVIFSGMIKDFLCLPRPLSPPLHRISISGYVTLEYGFLSTHSTNAVSAALALFYAIRSSGDYFHPMTRVLINILLVVYVLSICLGRIYCGMHGFLDVAIGSTLGSVIFYLRLYFSHTIDSFIMHGGVASPLTITLIILVLVRVHPEPVDPCPCFEDSVAFAGVVLGVDLALWYMWDKPYAWMEPQFGPSPVTLSHPGLIRAVLRMLIGITSIFIWRAIMKKLLLRYLPPIFRVVEKIGLSMPRVFFLRASEYSTVPSSVPDSTLVGAREIPSLIKNISRGRSDSVGPQSTADMYETLAYRDERQRTKPSSTTSDDRSVSSKEEKFTTHSDLEEEIDDELLFLQVQPPRVRYDVEVVTKLIVYTGIGICGAQVGLLTNYYLDI
ncbi:PAP2 superfamily-domain-containing protein [Lipomyces oligophaga]|uniref:PAP2 superfamily-domain-containing protein n=1 Tax=Lipomyces oligophaga TaxID=45792 RepID=UPI0034CF956F